MKKLIIIAMLLAISLTALLVGVAVAGTPTNIRMSDAPNGPEVTAFPSGTTVVHIVFDYVDMEEEELRVRVYDNVGNILFEQAETYTGSGTESIAVSFEGGAFPDSRYVTNLYRGEYLGKTIIWSVGEPIPRPSPETIEGPAAPPRAERGNLPFILALVAIMVVLIVLVALALRRALAAG